MKKVAVIGAGASGIVAALFAARQGHKVVLFEKQKKIGRKISVSGNGQCNISNRDINVHHYHGHNEKFVYNIFSRFGLEESTAFFESIGIPFLEGKQGRFYPYSMQAQSVVQLLEYELTVHHKVDLQLHRRIDAIRMHAKKFVLLTAGKEKHYFDSVIIAAGSTAYAPLGGSRSGYQLATALGHHVYEPFPVILPINIPYKKIHRLEGIKWDCTISVLHNSNVVTQSMGEILFTRYGISGPVTLNVSRWVNEGIISKKAVTICIDFFPHMDEDTLYSFLRRLCNDQEKTVQLMLSGILKRRMPEVLLEILSLPKDTKVKHMKDETLRKIVSILKGLELQPGEIRSFNEAVACAGGVDVNEINPATMESRLVPNLYIVGELLDIDGDSGGFNLQFAWSTGALAGQAQ